MALRVELITNDCIDSVFDTFNKIVCIKHHTDGMIEFQVADTKRNDMLLRDIMAFVTKKEGLVVNPEDIDKMVANQFIIKPNF